MARRHRHRTAHPGPGPVPADPTVAVPRAAARGSRAGLLLRSALLGVASGSRASLALAAPTLRDPDRGRPARVVACVGVLAELVGDKLPTTPSRLLPPGPQSRAVAASLGGAALARQRGRAVWVPAAVAGLASFAGTVGGAAWRAWAAEHGPDWRAAVAEDAAAIALAAVATRR